MSKFIQLVRHDSPLNALDQDGKVWVRVSLDDERDPFDFGAQPSGPVWRELSDRRLPVR